MIHENGGKKGKLESPLSIPLSGHGPTYLDRVVSWGTAV
jgi:hypothetical protein